MTGTFEAPTLDYAALSPLIALAVGLVAIVLTAVFRPLKRLAPGLAILSMAVAAGCLVWQFGTEADLVSGSLRIDGLSTTFSLLILIAGIVAVLYAAGDIAGRQVGRPDFLAMLLSSVFGMVMLTMANDLITFFLALEFFSIPLYVLCATDLRRPGSLEAGLKYLIIGSLGSATLLFGMAMIYGGSGGEVGFQAIAEGLTKGGVISDSLVLFGIGMITVGLAFKVSIAPFHQWTPDVYQGAPTPVTAFMSGATKLAAFAVFARFFLVALAPETDQWDVILAVLATLSIAIGNLGALTQSSLKRMLGYSGVAQAGYMLAGIIVATADGVDALTFYLAAYLAMNLAAFGALIVHERMTGSDSIASLRGAGNSHRIVAWPMTIAMLGLAGLPPTAGFLGKVFLIEALADQNWVWLAIVIVIGTMLSLAYYLRVVAVMWTNDPAPQGEGGHIDGDLLVTGGTPPWKDLGLVVPIVIASVAVIFFGIFPDPLYDFASRAGDAITSLTG